MAPRKKPEIIVEKAQVAFPPPGTQTRFALIGRNKTRNDTVSYARRSQGAIYYEMYRQHPVVRAAIDKKSAFAVSGGIKFISREPGEDVPREKLDFLNTFMRRSSYKQLLRLTYKDLDIYGECFWAIIYNKQEPPKPIKALRLNPRFMEPRITNGFVSAWQYGPISTSEKAIWYEMNEILHFKLDDPEDDTRGLSPLHSLQHAVAQDIFAMEFNEAFFKNSAQTGIVFIQKTTGKEEAERNRAWIEQNYSGPENAHRPLLIEGDVDVKSSVAKPVEMQFLEGRKFLRQEILMVLEMDPDKVGIHEDANRSVSKEMAEAFHSETIWPRQGVVEEVINNTFISEVLLWNDVIFAHNETDPRRTQDQAETWDKHQNSGRFTINHIRKLMGLDVLKGGDEAFIMTPTGLIFVRSLPELAEQQVVNGGLPIVAAGGLGSRGQSTPSTQVDSSPKQTRRQAEATSQKS